MRIRRYAALIACFLVTSPTSAQRQGWRADPAVVRQVSSSRAGFNFEEAAVPAYELPVVLGTSPQPAVTRETWRARRTEILDLFRENVYGRSPGPPERISFEILQEDPLAMAGDATLKRVRVTSGIGQRDHVFELTLFIPNRLAGAAPVFLLLNNRPASNVDPTRATRSGFWPAEDLVARGFAIASLQVAELAPDDSARFRDGAIALFEDAADPRRSDAWGALAAWAWGASRAMDYFETDPRVDARRVAIVGHSRGGKAALWAGAEDERFALVVSNDSGEGGAALSRRGFGETIAEITRVFPHWFTPAYRTFGGREAALPADQHMLLASIAPRALYVASANEDLWADPRGEFLSLAASSPAFQLYGDPAIEPGAMPPLDISLTVGRRGYHVRAGPHDLTPYDWARFADFATKLWGR